MPNLINQIFLWSGSIASIPASFVLCDGSNGSPDLRDRFVIGAGDTYAPDDTGGSVNHNHPFTTDGHFHTLTTTTTLGFGVNFSSTTSTEIIAGTTDNASTLPPFFALAFIMFIG